MAFLTIPSIKEAPCLEKYEALLFEILNAKFILHALTFFTAFSVFIPVQAMK